MFLWPTNQGKLEVVKQEMARVNIDILGISEPKWTGMGVFISNDHYIYYCGQESWGGLPFPPPGDLPDPGIEPRSLALQADSLLSESPGFPLLVYIN